MIAFEVKDMTCGHCVSTITKAVKALDPGARVQIDLANHRVEIDTSANDAAQLGAAITAAGYISVAIQRGAPPAATSVTPTRSGSGCCCR